MGSPISVKPGGIGVRIAGQKHGKVHKLYLMESVRR